MIKEKNDIRKEYYDNDKLKYEGEYLNGKRNGNGKEYDWLSGELIFEGEYKDEKRWNGIEKEYINEHCLKFEREYKNGEKKE